MLNTKEHADIMLQFEKEYKYLRLDREDRSIWPRGNIYQDGQANRLYLVYRNGYALAKCVYQQPPSDSDAAKACAELAAEVATLRARLLEISRICER